MCVGRVLDGGDDPGGEEEFLPGLLPAHVGAVPARDGDKDDGGRVEETRNERGGENCVHQARMTGEPVPC